MRIDDAILINQLAQQLVAMDVGEKWFNSLNVDLQRKVLREINVMILQASPLPEDAALAISTSGLKATLTPCVLVAKPNIREQLAKIANLPDTEFSRVFKLLIAFLGVADKRRRDTKPMDSVSHWWHRDLGNPDVLADIRGRYSEGRL